MEAASVTGNLTTLEKRQWLYPLCLLLLLGCDGEPPLDLQRGRTELDAAMIPVLMDEGIFDAAPLDLPDGICPDLTVFESDVLPQVDSVCGACHAVEHNPANNYFEWYSPGRVGDLTPRQIQDNLQETLRLVDFDNPDDSPLLAYHRDQGDTHGIFTPTRAAVVTSWIAAGTIDCPDEAPDAGVDPMPNPIGPCGPIVDRDRYGTASSRALWFAPGGINELLVGTSAIEPGKCGDATCHGAQGVGGTLWLATRYNDTSAACNLQVVEAFINRVDVDRSDLLVKPLGETPVTPEGGVHGGQTVFRGRDDPDYIRLRNWVIEGGLR
tara:strand:+ start:127 stop:1098 length:972 start_codon:yes stop_codon:yes gene_type:complete